MVSGPSAERRRLARCHSSGMTSNTANKTSWLPNSSRGILNSELSLSPFLVQDISVLSSSSPGRRLLPRAPVISSGGSSMHSDTAIMMSCSIHSAVRGSRRDATVGSPIGAKIAPTAFGCSRRCGKQACT